MDNRMRRWRGETMVGLLAVIFIVLTLAGFALPTSRRAREVDKRIACARNLSQIGRAILLYSNENKGLYPRTYYVKDNAPSLEGQGKSTANDPFGGAGLKAPFVNNVPEALFLLLRTEDITSPVFVCPSSAAKPDLYGGGTNTPMNQIDFGDIQKNLSYSYTNPYPDENALASGFAMKQGLDPEFAVLADINPGNSILTKLKFDSPMDQLRLGNSPNHQGDGQNVLYGDGHVEFQSSVFVGVNRDNIYTRGGPAFGADVPQAIIDSPYAANDSVLLPVAAAPESPAASQSSEPATPKTNSH